MFCIVNCTDEDSIKLDTQIEMKDFSLQEAKTFFEKQSEVSLITSRSLNNKSITPGDFIPKWEVAIGSSKNGIACYDIPITPTYQYKAIHVDEKNGFPSAGKVNIYQKLIIIKDLNSKRMGQYILTLIPSKTYDNKYSHDICNKFINCADKGEFTGIAIYSCVYSNLTARVSQYKNGIKTDGVFLLSTTSKTDFISKYEQARMLVSAITVQRKNVVLTRGEDDYDFTYDGGWLDDVIVTPPDYSEWGENEMEDWINSSRPDTSPIDPEPEPENPATPDDESQDNSNNDTEQKPIQSQDFIAAKDDKFVIAKLPDRMEKQIGYTCVTSIISYIKLTLGGTATYDSNGVLKVDHGTILQEYINYQIGLNPNLSTGAILMDIIGNGMHIEKIAGFVDKFFTTVPADNITFVEAINNGYIIMTTIKSEMEQSAHNIAVIGYHTNGNLIYMDPEYGCWREAPVSALGLYAYVISGVK